MRIIPVIDLKAGRAVHAVAGDRAHYQPIRSRLHASSDPIGLALAYRDVLGLSEVYLADLDAIAGAPPAVGIYRALRELGLTPWVDAGVRGLDSLPPLRDAGIGTVVVGLETVRSFDALAELAGALGPAMAFSLDLRDGRPLNSLPSGAHRDEIFRSPLPPGERARVRGAHAQAAREDARAPLDRAGPSPPPLSPGGRGEKEPERLTSPGGREDDPSPSPGKDETERPRRGYESEQGPMADPLRLAEFAIRAGCSRLILLDLARVGTGSGVGTLTLLADLRAAHPDAEFTVGGGIAGPGDLPALERAGASAVLVGSALHDGRIGPGDLRGGGLGRGRRSG